MGNVLIDDPEAIAAGGDDKAFVQLAEGAEPAALKLAILAACRAELPREAVPASLRFVEGFATNAAGKLLRQAGSPATAPFQA